MLNVENVDLLIDKQSKPRKKKQLKLSATSSVKKYKEEFVDLGSVNMEDIISLVDKSIKKESMASFNHLTFKRPRPNVDNDVSFESGKKSGKSRASAKRYL